MPVHASISDSFKGMIKSSGYIKHFRHQCTTLIQICREFWAQVEMTDKEDSEYQSFQKFVVIANRALQAIKETDKKKSNKELLQGELDKAIVDLEEYRETLSGLENYDPVALMLEARIKDQERSFKIMAVDKLKQIPESKSEVDFYIHDGSDRSGKIRLNISKKSGSEEVLFKLGRKVEIKLHENAYFYTGPDIIWENSIVHIPLGSGPSTYRPKKGIPDFKTYFGTMPRGPVHVFVDRNPSIHVLLTTKVWSRLFSLAKLITINKEKIVVLKSADGSLYHAQQVVGKLVLPEAGAFGILRRNRETNSQDRVNASLNKPDCVGILHQAREFIIAEDKRRMTDGGWLIEVKPMSNKPPDISMKEPMMTRKPVAKRRNLVLDLPPSTGNATTSLTPAVLGVSGAGDMEDATTRVKKMVAMIEEKEGDKKGKKGFFGRVFGRS